MTALAAITNDPWFTIKVGHVELTVRQTESGLVARIGPDEAAALLDQSENNRPKRYSHVANLSREMTNGYWDLNGESVKFALGGNNLDGQHRLLAIVDSGVTIETYIVINLPLSARDSIDKTLVRTAGDSLGFRGETDARTLASVLRVAWSLETNGHLFNGAGIPWPTTHELLAYLASNPLARRSTGLAANVFKSPVRMQKSMAGGLHYLMFKRSPEQADEFWHRLIDGAGLYPGHPVLALRNALIRDLSATRRLPFVDKAAVTIKAWNAFREKRALTQIRWRRAGTNPESFPEIK